MHAAGGTSMATQMRLRQALFSLLLAVTVALHALPSAGASQYRQRSRRAPSSSFMLQEPEEVARTEAGAILASRGPPPLHMGFIHMEPNSLFLPQYLDSTLVLFVRLGELKVGRMYEGEMVVNELKAGDIYHIPAGTAFYMVNPGIGQRVHIICSIDTSYSLGLLFPYQPFFIGGGIFPASVLSGFDTRTLSTAFNVSCKELGSITKRQAGGPIIRLVDEAAHRPELEVDPMHNNGKRRRGSSRGANVDAYNIYEKDPDFENSYGRSTTVDRNDYRALNESNIGVYLVNLTAGSMLAPHLNPTAAEYGVVLGGSGRMQVVFPNGSSAMSTKIKEGDVFWVPRYLPFSYIASKSVPMEIFGFTTSSRRSRPQFLTGARSVLGSMMGAELAAAFGASEEEMEKVVGSQRESHVVPAWGEPSEHRHEGEPPAPSCGGVVSWMGSGVVDVFLLFISFLLL